MKKTILLSLSLASSLLRAEDNGFFCERGLSNRRSGANGQKHR